MADSRDEIEEMIRTQLQRSNPPDTEALYGRAVQIDKAVRELSLRQFNAKYVLQVKREMKQEEEGAVSRGKAQPTKDGVTEEDRDRIRDVLLAFTREVVESDQAEMIEVVGNTDEYVEEILGAVQR